MIPKNRLQETFDYLKQFLTDERLSKIEHFSQESSDFVLPVMEDVYQFRNAAAIVRSVEACGFHHVVALEEENVFNPNLKVTKGAETWVKVEKMPNNLDSLKEIKKNPNHPNLRRLIVLAWNPANASISKLPPCHYTFAFNVMGNKLNCHLTQRSGDVALGIPFNLACYSLLTMMIAKETGFEAGEFAHTIIDCHVYENHVEGLKEQLKRTPRELPKLNIADKAFDELGFDDITVEGYEPDPVIKFEVAV